MKIFSRFRNPRFLLFPSSYMVKLLRDREYLEDLVSQIPASRRSIEASVFLMDPGEAPVGAGPLEKIFGALARAKKRGVKIRLRTSKIFAAKPPGKRLAALALRHRLEIEWVGPAEFLHEKSVAIDGDEGVRLIGSHNWSPPSLSENHELSLRTGREGRVLDASGFRRELLEALPLAQKEITLATYDITDIASSDADFADLVTRQLVFARMKKRKVRVILDASVSRSAGGSDLILYRGRAKAEELARQGVHVYYDTTGRLFHAKVLVIDGEDVFIGSQNIYPARQGELEKTVRVKSAGLAADVKTYLAGILKNTMRFRYHPLAQEGVRIPGAWVRRGGALARIFQARGTKTFKLLLALLHERERLKSAHVPWDVRRLASLAGLAPSVLTQPRLFLRRRGLVKYRAKFMTALKTVTLLDGKGKSFSVGRSDFFILPWQFWTYGWAARLRPAEIYNYLIHVAEVARSPEAPVWSRRVRDIPALYGISSQRFAKNSVLLERANLIEITRDPKIVVPHVPKKANRYRLNPLWSEEEFQTALGKLKEEFMASEKMLGEARRLSARLNQPYDRDEIRTFLTLIERYGPADVRKAAAITARFAPQFALRNVHHTAAILRNWSNGKRKK